jgi:hypothetical protein
MRTSQAGPGEKNRSGASKGLSTTPVVSGAFIYWQRKSEADGSCCALTPQAGPREKNAVMRRSGQNETSVALAVRLSVKPLVN